MIEEFRIFAEYPKYEVSSLGYLRRVTPGPGTRPGHVPGRVTWGARRADGYLQVFGFKPFNLMHQIVSHVFLGPCPDGFEPNHKDLNRMNNAAANLEYLTHADNLKHSFANWTPEQQEELRRRARTNLEWINP